MKPCPLCASEIRFYIETYGRWTDRDRRAIDSFLQTEPC